MVSWTDCAGKHQLCGALGWGGLIISLWNIHYSTWNYTELTGLQVHWEVHDPLEQTQSRSGMKPFHFAPHSTRALPPIYCTADAFSLLFLWFWLWLSFAVFVQYVAQWGPDTYMEPLGGSMIQIIMFLRLQDILIVLSFRSCNFFTPFTDWPYSSVILSLFS